MQDTVFPSSSTWVAKVITDCIRFGGMGAGGSTQVTNRIYACVLEVYPVLISPKYMKPQKIPG